MSSRITAVRAAAVFMCVAAAACRLQPTPDAGPGDDSGVVIPATRQVRILHAVADAPTVDVYVNQGSTRLTVVEDVSYTLVSRALTLTPGTYTVEIRPANAAAASTPVLQDTVTVPESLGEVLVAVVGSLNSMAADARARLVVLQDGFDEAGAQARVRFVHASPDAPAVGFDVGNDGTVEASAVARFASSGAAGLVVPAGRPSQVALRDGANAVVTTFTLPSLPAGTRSYFFATGSAARPARAADGLGLLEVRIASVTTIFVRQDPLVYVFHGSANAGAVDVFNGATLVADNAQPGALAGPLRLPPGETQLDFFANAAGTTRPTTPPAASGGTGPLFAGERYLVVATGLAGAPGSVPVGQGFRLFSVDERFETDMAPRLRLVHGSPDAPSAVDVGVLTTTPGVDGGTDSTSFAPLFTSVPFGGSSPGGGITLTPPTAPLRVAVRPAGSPVNLATIVVPPAAIAQGTKGYLVAFGQTVPGPMQEGFKVALVTTSGSTWAATVLSPETPPTGKLRLIQLSPDMPAIDLFILGRAAPLATNVRFGDYVGPFDVPEGTLRVQFRATGTTNVLYERSALVAANTRYALAALGSFAATPGTSGALRVPVLTEAFATPMADNARLRFINATTDLAVVGLDVEDVGAPNTNEVTSLPFGDEGEAAGAELTVASLSGRQLSVRVTGETGARITAFTLPTVPSASQWYAVLGGFANRPNRLPEALSLYLVPAGDMAGTAVRVLQNPVVFALHAGTDAPSVDLFAGDTELVDNLAYTRTSARLQLPPSTTGYALDVFATRPGNSRFDDAGMPLTPAASFTTPALAAGGRYLAVATGLLAEAPGSPLGPRLVTLEESFDETSRTDARVRILHGAPAAPTVDVGTLAGNTFTPLADLQGLPYLADTGDGGRVFPTGQFLTMGLRVTGTSTTVGFNLGQLANGTRAYAVAAGELLLPSDAGVEDGGVVDAGAPSGRNPFRIIIVPTSNYTATAIAPN